ncbi:MAG: 5-(carboxyamino)imidazole ribonucleotide mutase [Planctomycetota bacterium]|nr:5-(carboxyamino)imidazole ribonucleotide mutase [Planctomycetota bacterium]MDG2143440.1 5-(carboxyamino)imidazole ribonucleotide mutase [Planctomycetota bacterium]
MTSPKVAILMGSDSDADRLQPCFDHLAKFGVPFEAKVRSAHRTPAALVTYLAEAEAVGVQVFLCAAGSAAHLAGVVAAHTLKPVMGIPMDNPPLGGLDALLATVQMPSGIPVATVAVGGGGPANAALFAIRILALQDEQLAARLVEFREEMADKVEAKDAALQARFA